MKAAFDCMAPRHPSRRCPVAALAILLPWLALLAACQPVPTRPQAAASAPAAEDCSDCPDRPATTAEPDAQPPADPDIQAAPAAAPAANPAAEPAGPAVAADPWVVLQQALKPSQCDNERVRHWLQRYLGRPERFSARLSEYAPLLHYVSHEVELRQLPASFALVPMVESTFHGFPGIGGGPAGMWQLMPGTARSLGLRVGAGQDDRLDHVRATHAALDYLQRLWTIFEADPKLTLAAYNAGDGRVSRAIRQAGHRDVARLPLPRITQEYLIKVEALSCLFKHAAQHELALPPLPPSSRLEIVILPFPADAGRLASELKLPEADFRRYNGAWKGPIWRPAGHAWLVPAARAGALARVSAAAVEPTAKLTTSIASSGVHVVQRGDTLWALSRRYGLRLDDLLRWNGLNRRSTLSIGQRLRLAP